MISARKTTAALVITRPTTSASDPETRASTLGRVGTTCFVRNPSTMATTPSTAPTGGAKNAAPTAAIDTTASRIAVRRASAASGAGSSVCCGGGDVGAGRGGGLPSVRNGSRGSPPGWLTGLSSLIVPVAPRRPARVVVLASGTGSVFDALAASFSTDDGIEITGLVCDQPGAGALDVAERAGIASEVVELANRSRRAEWDERLATAIDGFVPDLVVSAGFMRLLGPAVLGAFPDRVINTHPALLPAFPGAHAVRDALRYGVKVTGATVHLVDAGVDTGPVLAQRAVEVRDDDDEAALHERIKQVERSLLPSVVAEMLAEGWTIDGRRVTIP